MRKIYIAGPMSGIAEHNAPLFYKCAEFLHSSYFKNEKFEIFNPADNIPSNSIENTWEYYMKMDLPHLVNADTIVLLKDWERSKGANLEFSVAKALGLEIYIYNDQTNTMKLFDGNAPGMKFDRGKLRYDLVPPEAYKMIVEVITYGAQKYKDNNWQSVTAPNNTYYSAILRHLEAWRAGEIKDPESGLSHLAHAGCSILFLLWFQIQ